MPDSGSDLEVVDDNVLLQPNIDFESLEFDHRFVPQHWEDVTTTLLPNHSPFTRPSPSPVRHPNRRPVGAQEFFNSYWRIETLNQICEQTNKYARQPSYGNWAKQNGGLNWFDVSLKEIRCWLGICIMMGLKKLSNNRLYWDRRNFFGCPLIKATMCRARLEKIC